jgi:uncharacterized repeat protein (TIGR03803 family)
MVLVNGSDTLAMKPGATSFTMPTAVAYTSTYAVTVQTQPTGLICSVSNGTGTIGSAAVTNIAVTCSANTYTVGGTISGLTASGLVLLDNGRDATTLSAHATQFTMNTGVAYGAAYAITVQTQPTGLVCPVSNGTGTMGATDVTSVSIACVSNFALLYSFAGGSGDAADPYHTLIQGSDGDFYGTTIAGGSSNVGTIFKITPSGIESVFYSFAGIPYSGLVQGSDGNIYGTTASGGTSGRGTVFKITPSGTETVLHAFAKSGSDGETPYAGLIQGSDGNFYGTTYFGGASGFGTVFKLTPSGTETILHTFTGGAGDGANPSANLVQGSDGNLYGSTGAGGTSGNGTFFKVKLQ